MIGTDERNALAAIYKSIALTGSNIDPQEVVIEDGGNFIQYDKVLKCYLYRDCDVRLTHRGVTLSNLFTTFAVEFDCYKDGSVKWIGIYQDSQDNQQFDLPVSIGCLKHLRSITLEGCQYLHHQQLPEMPNLKELTLLYCRWQPNLVDPQLSLPNLTCLDFYKVDLPPLFSFFSWLKDHLPILETLKVNKSDFVESDFVIENSIGTESSSFHNSLRSININYSSKFNEDLLEIFMFEALPKFPMVTTLDLDWNGIKSFQPIANRLNALHRDNAIFKSVVSSISLHGNPACDCFYALDKELKNCKETKAFCGILRAFPTIYEVDENCSDRRIKNKIICNDILLNRFGRKLVRGRQQKLPVSIWPLVLVKVSRKWRESTRDMMHGSCHADIIFYFLRNNPELVSWHRRRGLKRKFES